jgi:hypothetical protein
MIVKLKVMLHRLNMLSPNGARIHALAQIKTVITGNIELFDDEKSDFRWRERSEDALRRADEFMMGER